MRKTLTTLVLISAAVVVTGCGVNGKWELSTVDPTAARRDFEFQSLTLQSDGSFYAESSEAGEKIRTTSGTYTYQKGTLRLVEHDGEAHSYDAVRQGDELVLKQHWHGQPIKAKFVRKES